MPYIPVAVVNESTGVPDPGPPPVAGFIAHYDASDLTTLTLNNGVRVSTWADKAGNFNASQSTDANRPVVTTHPTLLNTRSALYCDGSNDQFTTSCPASDRTETSFHVACVVSLAAVNPLIGGTNGVNGGRGVRIGTTGFVETVRQGVSTIFASTVNAVTAGTPFVSACILDTTTCEHRLNNTTESTSNSDTFTASRVTNIASGATAQFLTGWIAEVLIYDTTLSSGDVDQTITYLMSKWGIS